MTLAQEEKRGAMVFMNTYNNMHTGFTLSDLTFGDDNTFYAVQMHITPDSYTDEWFLLSFATLKEFHDWCFKHGWYCK